MSEGPLRQILVMSGEGPIVKNVPLLTPAIIKDVHTAVLAETYTTPDDELAIEMGLPPSKYHGRTLLEVMILKRAEHAARGLGDPDVVEKILDRELGKPKTTAEVHSITETYDQALKRIGAIEAEVVEEPWTQL